MVRSKVEKKLIAITGGIGSGKSTVSSIILSNGHTVISADEIVSELYKKRCFLQKIKKLFPLAVKGVIKLSVDKSIIASEVFFDREKREKLNELIHPIVIKKGLKRYKKSKTRLNFMEVPLLFEGKFESLFDNVIVVLREKESRITGVMSRSNLTKEQVIERMKSQIDYDSEDFSKFITIENNKDIKQLEKEVTNKLKSL